jgi:hypothetical protein
MIIMMDYNGLGHNNIMLIAIGTINVSYYMISGNVSYD